MELKALLAEIEDLHADECSKAILGCPGHEPSAKQSAYLRTLIKTILSDSNLDKLVEGLNALVSNEAELKCGGILCELKRLFGVFTDIMNTIKGARSVRVRCWLFAYAHMCLDQETQKILTPDGVAWEPLLREIQPLQDKFHAAKQAIATCDPWASMTASEFGDSNTLPDEDVKLLNQETRVQFELMAQAQETKKRFGNWIENSGATLTKWVFPFSEGADTGCVLAFPTRLEAHDTRASNRGGMAFLSAFPSTGNAGWEFPGFSLEQSDQSHLDSLARIAIGLVAGIHPDHVPPKELMALRQKYQFLLLFGAEVYTGLSHSGVILILLVICYLHYRLGEEALRLTSFRSGFVVSMEIEYPGNIRPVDGICEKLSFLRSEWSNRTTLCLARENRKEVESLIKKNRQLKGEVRYFGPEDLAALVEQVLGPLKDVRREWLLRISSTEFNTYWRPRLTPNSVQEWDSIHTGENSDGSHVIIDNSPVFAFLARKGSTAFVRFSFNDAGQGAHTQNSRRALIIVCSGCTVSGDEQPSPDSEWWRTEHSITPLTRAVYQIMRGIFENTDGLSVPRVYVHFLSERKPVLEADRLIPGEAINQILMRKHKDLHLEKRGRYLRPVLDYWRTPPEKTRGFDLTEMVVLSNEEIVDFADESESGRIPGITSVKRLFLGPLDRVTSWICSRTEDMCRTRLTPDQIEDGRLALEFGHRPYVLQKATVTLGENVGCFRAFRATSDNWSLNYDKDKHTCNLHFASTEAASACSVVFRLPEELIHPTIDVEVTYKDGDVIRTRSETCLGFPNSFSGEKIPEIEEPIKGQLDVNELKRVQGDAWCHHCQQDQKHLYCTEGLTPVCALGSLQSVVDKYSHPGIFAINRTTGEFRFSPWSVLLTEASILLSRGQLILVHSDGRVVQDLSIEGDCRRATIGHNNWLFFRTDQ